MSITHSAKDYRKHLLKKRLNLIQYEFERNWDDLIFEYPEIEKILFYCGGERKGQPISPIADLNDSLHELRKALEIKND